MIDEDQMEAICARHAAMIGMSGSGKTFTEKGFVEWLLERNRHTVIVDPLGHYSGLRTNAAGDGPGYGIPIFGGEHGDWPINVFDGLPVADIVLGQKTSCIVDLSQFRTGADQRMFMEGFIGALRGKPKAALNLIIDEADEFAPETVADRVGNRLREDLVWIAKRGRGSGFILHILTQRPADIAKSVLTQMQTLIVHQLIAPNDQKPALDWLKGHGDKTTLKLIADSLAALAVGERWIYSPRNRILDRDTSPPIGTFDSSRAPEPGETVVEPKMLREIDVSGIQAMLETVRAAVPASSADSQDQNELRDRIADLEGEAVQAATREALISEATRHAIEQMRGALDGLEETLGRFDQPLEPVAAGASIEEKILKAVAGISARAAERVEEAMEPIRRLVEGDVELGATAKAFADMLDAINPARVTWAQLAAMTGRKARGGNFNSARKQLRDSGRMVEEGDYLRSAAPAPRGMTRDQALGLWRGALSRKPTAVKILDLLAGAANPMTKDEIGEALGLATRGGNWNDNFAQLRNNNLIHVASSGEIALAAKLPGER